MGSITGAVPLIEKQQAHHGFVDAVHPPVVALKINHAQRYVRDGETAASVFPDQTKVVTTTTVNDTTLSYLRWEDEFEILREFQPDYHVPVDYPTYRSTDDENLQTYVRKMAEGLVELSDRLDSHRDDFQDGPPELLPLARKYLPKESVPNPVDVGARLGLNQYAFYATQYFTSPDTSFIDLVDDLEQAAAIIPDDASLFVLGSLSPYHLHRFPEAVTAVSGLNAWRKRVTPRDNSPAEIRDSYHDLATEVNAELGATVATSYHPDAPSEMAESTTTQPVRSSLDQFTASPE